jgi:hypothetical protein
LVNQKVLLKVLQRIMPRGIAFVANNGAEALEVRGGVPSRLPACLHAAPRCQLG